MQIQLNGEERQTDAATIAALVAALALDTRKVAVERNREIVPRARYADITLSEGDRIEIVQFIGGG